jgi:protein-arginine kinase activator protein McsA
VTTTRARKYRPGDHKVICDLCGLTFMRTDCRLQWDNLLACDECYSPKHPQLNIRGKSDRQNVDIARPESENDEDLYFYTPTADDL